MPKQSRVNFAEPTMSKTQQNQYISNLKSLFVKFRTRIREILQRNRELAADITPINLSQFNAEMDAAINELITLPAIAIIEQRIDAVYKSGSQFASVKTGQEALPLNRVDWRAIDAIKARNLSALKGITDEMSKQITNTVSQGMFNGDAPGVIAKSITDRVDKIGITRATTMARTEVITAFNQAAELRYAQYGITELEWLTAEDELVCPVCGPLNGKTFTVRSNHIRPPAHPNCRCAIIPVMD